MPPGSGPRQRIGLPDLREQGTRAGQLPQAGRLQVGQSCCLACGEGCEIATCEAQHGHDHQQDRAFLLNFRGPA